MGTPVNFTGANASFHGHPDREAQDIVNLPVMTGRNTLTSCWELSPDEIAEITRTGCIYLTILGRSQPPVHVGSEKEARGVLVDYGTVLTKQE